jgi:lipopolysaccharide transport system ATP-binding protein
MQVATTSAPILSLRNVGIGYQRRRAKFWAAPTTLWALQDISLDLYEGETLGVVGRNGAGKTTLLRLLAGVIQHDYGEFTTHGHSVAMLSIQLGFVQHLSGRENVVLSGLLLGMSKAEVESKLDSIIDFAELEDFIDEPINTYSAGMRARLGFATAFHIDPDILLVDEVLGVGDAQFVAKSKEVMKQKIRSDKTVVLVSHAEASIRELCDRVVWIHRGRTMREGPTDEVMSAYSEWIRTHK